MDEKIKAAVIESLITRKNEQKLSLCKLEKKLGYSDTYISQAISQKIECSDRFIATAFNFLMQ